MTTGISTSLEVRRPAIRSKRATLLTEGTKRQKAKGKKGPDRLSGSARWDVAMRSQLKNLPIPYLYAILPSNALESARFVVAATLRRTEIAVENHRVQVPRQRLPVCASQRELLGPWALEDCFSIV